MNLILISFTRLQIAPPLSFFRVDFLNDIFLFVTVFFPWMSTVDSVYLVLFYLDNSMPLLEPMLLSSLLTPVEIGPSNASPV